MVSLSTTLATNAITEGNGAHICLVLIGYDYEIMHKQGFMKEMVTDDILFLKGGHDLQGDEKEPLNKKIVEKRIRERHDYVEAFAVSGYFSTRNPAHELEVRNTIESITDLPVTCAHELTSRLNAVCRAITVSLNAQLIPLLQDLIRNVEYNLRKLKINAPLMIVKGDGSIIPAKLAAQRPVETILSGPAASALGGFTLSGRKNIWVIDIGGTTTDIALLEQGRPKINPQGAYIGHRRTMVEAIDIHTVGLGGDSLVEITREGEIVIGPRRAIPLCKLATDHPEILESLIHQKAMDHWDKGYTQFVLACRTNTKLLSATDRAILKKIEDGPLALIKPNKNCMDITLQERIEHIEKNCQVQRSGFTPTDALHFLGRFKYWNQDASQLGAEIMARILRMNAKEFCELVICELSDRIMKAILSKAMQDNDHLPQWSKGSTALTILNQAIHGNVNHEFSCLFKLNKPIVAIGAPVEAFMPRVAANLNTKLIVPEFASVANAFGAATSHILQRRKVVIRMMEGGEKFRAHLPNGIKDFSDLEDAIAFTRKEMTEYMMNLAEKANAKDVVVQMTQKDHEHPQTADWIKKGFIDTELEFVALGRAAFNGT
jgi:N-methylhydantoinase A/oxoprolinase/acetone carboxylase beta subunit